MRCGLLGRLRWGFHVGLSAGRKCVSTLCLSAPTVAEKNTYLFLVLWYYTLEIEETLHDIVHMYRHVVVILATNLIDLNSVLL
jgi:hypothetical protein